MLLLHRGENMISPTIRGLRITFRRMAAHLTNSTKCPDLLAVSIYDTKHMHLLPPMAKEVGWIVKQQGAWSAEA